MIHHKLPQLRTIVQYTGLPPLSDQRRLHKSHGKHILSWEELAEIGKILTDNKLGENSGYLLRPEVTSICVSLQTRDYGGWRSTSAVWWPTPVE